MPALPLGAPPFPARSRDEPPPVSYRDFLRRRAADEFDDRASDSGSEAPPVEADPWDGMAYPLSSLLARAPSSGGRAWVLRRWRWKVRVSWRWVYGRLHESPLRDDSGAPILALTTGAASWAAFAYFRARVVVMAEPAAPPPPSPGRRAPLAGLPAHIAAGIALYAVDDPADGDALAGTCRSLRWSVAGTWRRLVERDVGATSAEAVRAIFECISTGDAEERLCAQDACLPSRFVVAGDARGGATDVSSTSWSLPGGAFEAPPRARSQSPLLIVIATEDGPRVVVGRPVRAGERLGALAGETRVRESFAPGAAAAPDAAAPNPRVAQGGILRGGFAALIQDPTLRRFYGDAGEIYVDAFDRTAGNKKYNYVISARDRGSVLLNCVRHAGATGRTATASPEISMLATADGAKVPRVSLIAARDLKVYEEISWNSFHVMSGPVVRAAAAREPAHVREGVTRPQTNDLGKLLAAIQEVNDRVVHRKGTHILYAF